MASGLVGRETALNAVRRPFARRFSPGLAERRLVLFLTDQLALLIALVGSGEFSARAGQPAPSVVAIAIAGTWWAIASAFDSYDLRRAAQPLKSVLAAWAAFLLTLVTLQFFAVVISFTTLPNASVFAFAALALGLLAVVRIGAGLVLRQPALRRRILLLGRPSDTTDAAQILQSDGLSQYQVVASAESPFLGANAQTERDLGELIRLHDPDEIVIVSPEDDGPAGNSVGALRRGHPGMTIRDFSELYEQLTGRVAVRYLCSHWAARAEAQAETQTYALIKRLVDIIVSAAALLALSPGLLLIALAIRVDSRGPVVYKQQRQGLHGRKFTILKFRTMFEGAEGSDAIWARRNDPRSTRVGRLLRPVHLDELPQLVNVLRGDMSLVGPRPERSEFIAQLEQVVPSYRARMLVRPGITGWAQVRFCYARSLEESIEKLEHDLYYVKHHSLFLDLVIALKTVGAVLWPPERELEPTTTSTTTRFGPGKSAPRGIHRVLVVGGAGYIGSVLCRQLMEDGYRVRVLDALLYGDGALNDLMRDSRFEFRRGDSRDPAAIVAALHDVQAVVHLGEIVGDPACALDEEATRQINFTGTRLVAEIAKGFGVRRFLYASSCSVYGASDELLTEDSALNPVSLYARAKIAAERSLLELQTDIFRPVIFRLATVYGLSPRPRFDLVVNLLAAQAASEGHIRVYGGDQWRPFVHVSDVARAMSLALRAPIDDIGGQIFNLGSEDQNHTIGQVAELVRECIPETVVESFAMNGDRRNYRVAFDKVRNGLGFEPQICVRAGIQEVVNAVRSGAIANFREPRFSNLASLGASADQVPIRARIPSGYEVLAPAAQEALAT
jgi:exopolysaccharide biosynthesis polyprenyl glycosylphosphotransferase